MPAVVTRRSRQSYASDLISVQPNFMNTPIERITHYSTNVAAHSESKMIKQWQDNGPLDNIRLTPFGPERTDYTYGDSGSYLADHIRKEWESPNMARLPLRALVEPQKETILRSHEKRMSIEVSKLRDRRKSAISVASSAVSHNQDNRESERDDETSSRGSNISSASSSRTLRSRCKQIQGEWCTHTECMVIETAVRRLSVDRQRNTNNTTNLLVVQDGNNTAVNGGRTRSGRRSARASAKTTMTTTQTVQLDPIDSHTMGRVQHLGASSSTYVYQYVPYVDSADAALDLTTQPLVSGDGPGRTGLVDGTGGELWSKRRSATWSRPVGLQPVEPTITTHSCQKFSNEVTNGSCARSWIARHIFGLGKPGCDRSGASSGEFVSSDMEESESATDELRIARHRIQRNDLASRPRMKLVSGLCEYGSRYARLVRRGTIEGLALILAVFFALGNLLLSAVRLISQLLRSIILKLFTPSPSVYSAEKPIHPRLSQFHEDRDSGRRSTITEPSITHRIVFSIWTGLKQLLHHCCRLLGFLCFLVPLLLLLAFLFAPVAIDDDTAADIKPFPSDLQCSRSVVDVLPSDANIWRTAWWRFRCLYYHYILTPPETYQKTTENIGSLASLWTILTHWWTQPRSNGSRTPPLPKFPTYVEHKLMEQLTQFSNMVNQRLELLTENLRSTDARVTGITEQSTLNTKALNNQMLQLQQQLNVYAYELKQWQSEWQVYHTAKRVSRPGVGDLVTDYQSLMNSTVNAINQTVLLQFDSLRAELRDDQSGYWKQNEESLSKLSTLLSNLRFQLTFRIRQTEHELEQLRSQLRSHLEKRTTSDQDAFTVVSELKSSINKLEKQYLTLHKTGLESESIARSAHEAVLQCNAQLLEGREDCRRAVSEQFESGISNLTDQLTAQITDLVEDAFLKQMHSKLSDSEWIYRVKQTATQVARESVEKALAERIDVHFEASDRLMNMSDIDTIQSLIDVALQRFAADRTGMADFALESAGGAVVGTRCTKTYTDGSALFSIFGIPLARLSNSPRTILQPGNNPGECWPFHGSTGQAVIRLSAPVLISAVSLEHLPRSLAPNERLDSAPKDFIIKGLDSEDDEEGIILGNFTYNINGPSIQTFSVHNQTEPRQYIEFAVLSNHGHPLYTCVYRLRVHGTMPE